MVSVPSIFRLQNRAFTLFKIVLNNMIHIRPFSIVSILILWTTLQPCMGMGCQQTESESVTKIENLPKNPYTALPATDWLLDETRFRAGLFQGKVSNEMVLSNGLISRTFRIAPNAATVAFENHSSGGSLIRGIQPEATVTLNGTKYSVGGMTGQPNYAFLKTEWLDKMQTDPDAFQFVRFVVETPIARFPWRPKRLGHMTEEQLPAWPPNSYQFRMDFSRNKNRDVIVSVHYRMFDGIPALCKWITVRNSSKKPISVDRFSSELLAVVEHDSRVEHREGVELPRPQNLHVETDFSFGGFNHENANRHVVHWREDPLYTTQVNYKRKSPCLLVVEPTYGPAQTIGAGAEFESFRTFELFYDSTQRERRSLSLRRYYRTIAPWVLENPLMHHMRVADPDAVRTAIDEAAEVGFEMIILSFGSGFNIENDSEDYLERWKDVAKYARSKGIEIGGYSLLSSRRIGGGNDIVSPQGSKPTHGNCPALTSEWGIEYYKKLRHFYEYTGFSLLEHDGPYPGDVDTTARPPLQTGVNDSRWAQARIANGFYRWCAERGIYINAPDYYYLNGTNKCGMGYREVNWSLPREMQLIHTRQNVFDGTWYKTPSMGWMFVPLSEYHGGGAAATIEPLDEHLAHYQKMVESNLGFGVQACYRGPRLFDSDRTKQMLKSKVDWFKKYRVILESDLIHGRRADGRDIDWMLHVNCKTKDKGMLVVFNPLERPIEKTIRLNLYYTGLTDRVVISERDQNETQLRLSRSYEIDLKVRIESGQMNWYVIR